MDLLSDKKFIKGEYNYEVEGGVVLLILYSTSLDSILN